MSDSFSVRFFFGLVILIAFSSCKKDDVFDPDEIDANLKAALVANGGIQGMDYFLMPKDGDYASIPSDPKNPLSADKIELGKFLFHETALANNPKLAESKGTYSCASCHHSKAGFQAGVIQGVADGGLGFGAKGEGRQPNPAYQFTQLDIQALRTPSAMNGAWQECTLWNGQFGATGPNAATEDVWHPDSPLETNYLGYQGLETQAIAGLDVHRMSIDKAWADSTGYTALFDKVFAAFPDSSRYSFETAGLAIAAYERTLMANESPWQKYLRGDIGALTHQQKVGALLFFDKANCVACHTGPALNEMAFYALGMKDLDGAGVYGDGPVEKDRKGRGGFTEVVDDYFKFKVPQLYNLKDVSFYGHGGSFTSIQEVVEYKNDAIQESINVPEVQIAQEFVALRLFPSEITAIVDFLENGLYDSNLDRYVPTALPSGNCFPNSDPQSKIDLGCN